MPLKRPLSRFWLDCIKNNVNRKFLFIGAATGASNKNITKKEESSAVTMHKTLGTYIF